MDELKKLRAIFTHKQKADSLVLLIFIVIGTAFELLGVSMILPVINSILDKDTILDEDPYKSVAGILGIDNPNTFVFVLLMSLIVLYIVKNIYLIFMYNRQYKYIYSNMRFLSTKLMRFYLGQSYSYHKKKNSSELLRNVNQDVADFFGTIQALVFLVTEGLTVTALIIYLFIKDKTITIAVGFILAILVLLFLKVYKKHLGLMGQKNRFFEAQVNKWVQQAFNGIKEVKVMNKEDFFFRKYDEAFAGRVKSEYTYHTMVSIPKPVIEAGAMCSLLGAISIKLLLGVNTHYFIPTISIFAVASIRMLPSFNRITEYLGTISYQKAAITSIYNDFLEMKEAEKSQNGGLERSKKKLSLKEVLHLQNVSFHYDDSDRMILDDISFDIKKNTSVAFIGQSGAGKTTLADIILGVLEPSDGQILADDINIEDKLDEWHNAIGYIPQNIYLMDDTIARNVAFGLSDEEIDMERLERACQRAQLTDTLKELPDGLNTVVGEHGVRFSGGQRQRIGIARALYNEPEILILDEATSALDNETEAAVMEAIDALHGEMTLIVIAHRLSTIRNCDFVYKIGKGKAELQPKGAYQSKDIKK
ncbi:ABC-type multidrug transport system, ATPase and permease component [Butyrivibrio fibrisolvens DSM 3071]|uniref:ABC-type multidrug transport system, ATPase and permease component n=1 Tax=Butyrivibrio fibrisolvens DSM 3071 TaxID=1121131 RepID=A0A1M6A7J6_BUTFI|nr:ABC transporter ATP-binding protein [Butyrivibrio fibrisolvens]SHI32436.1 ABC-type multidrug transport system, ATPase and permease component [Butyrivibrio fibrisolvens DSM 3071]